MIGAVFIETLRRHWRGMLWWGFGSGLLGASQLLVLQDATTIQQMGELMATLPPVFIDAFGGGDAQYMGTPAGYLGSNFFSLGLIIFAFYAVIAGLNVIANEEDRGQFDLLLSLPLARTRLVIEKSAAFALMLIGMAVIVFGCIAGGLLLVGTEIIEVDMTRVLESVINILPGALAILMFTVFVSALTGSRPVAVGASAAFVAIGYFVDIIGKSAPDSPFGGLSVLSYHRYYDGVFVMRDGLNIGNMSILLVVAAILFAVSIGLFNRRDVGV